MSSAAMSQFLYLTMALVYLQQIFATDDIVQNTQISD